MIQFLYNTHSTTGLAPGAARGRDLSDIKQMCARALGHLEQRKDLGFLQAPFRESYLVESINLANQLRDLSPRLVVVGLGGSALGGRCLVEALGQKGAVHFLSNSDPLAVNYVLSDSELVRSAQFLFISKSGNTLEIACVLDLLLGQLQKINRPVASAISVITERAPSPLKTWADENKVKCVDHPLDVGGRFSVFTPVGLVPAAFSGVDIARVLAGAKSALSSHQLALDLSQFYLESFVRGEFNSVFWSYSEKLNAFTNWLIQLWAESLAKKQTRDGQPGPRVSTPLAYSGTCDQHSVLQQLMDGAKDKSIGFLRVKASSREDILSGCGLEGFDYLAEISLAKVFDTQSRATEEALAAVGHTTYSLELQELSPESTGELLMIYQIVIGVMSEVLNINAYDQPGVELGKKITKEKLQKSSRL